MGLTFLVPLFLAGLAALTIPLLIHLTHRDRRDVVPFPSLMFLERIPFKTVRRQRIRHWLLFLLRSLAIVAIVLAFARPLTDAVGAGAADLARAREIVILLDRSMSMGYGDRWDRALQAARNVADRLGPEDRASLIVFSDQAEAVTQPSNDPVALRAAIERQVLGAGSTRYAPAIRLAERVLEASDLARKELVLVTDFQRSGWDREDDFGLPPGTELTRVDLSDDDPSNLAVTGATLERVTRGGQQRVTLSARVVSLGVAASRDVDVAFEIDGQALQTKTVTLDGAGAAMVRFNEVAVPPRVTRGTVRAGSDRLPQDNVFHFVLQPVEPLSVLVLHHPSNGSRGSLYLRRALEIGNQPAFDVALRSTSQFRASDLAGRSVVILNDAPLARGSGGAEVLRFASAGGGVLVALGRRSAPNAWPATARALLPGTLGAPVDRLQDRSGGLGMVDYDHPVFELFSQPRSGDFSEARFDRYRGLRDSAAVVLARFDDGAIALAERRVGEGRVLAWTSDFANLWNNLPVQPVFLPFVHRLVTYLADYAEPRQWYTAGQVLDLAGDRGLAAALLPEGIEAFEGEHVELVVDPPSGERDVQRLAPDAPYLSLQEQGFYQIRRLERENDGPSLVAVNVSAGESDLTSIDAEEFATALVSGAAGRGAVQPADLAAALSPEERERRQGLWWYLLLSLFFILAVESFFANRAQPAR